MLNDYLNILQDGAIISAEQATQTAALAWNQHPTCPGVALKHLITGKQTGGALSCHIVKVAAGCEITEHIHADKLELHEILSGNGVGVLVAQEIPYIAGTAVIIPASQPHKVSAGAEDLYLLAKFTPALL